MRTGLRSTTLAADALIFAVALAARIGVTYARGGSFYDFYGYDPSVYYAAADSFINGRVPYRDFTLLHPPGIVLGLSPVALIGKLTTDRAGYETATALALLVGAAGAVLAARIARAMGVRPWAAFAGGLLYAGTLLSSAAEFAARLEVFGNFLTLLGIWGFVTSARSPTRARAILTGAALAAATSVKIWYAVPLVVVLAWHLVDRRPQRSFWWAVAGGVGAAAVLDGPFAVLSGRSMFQMVVLDQLGRVRTDPILTRVSDMDLLTRLRPHWSHSVQVACAVAAAVLVAVILLTAWRIRPARLPVALFVSQLAVLLAAPVYFSSYADYAMPAAGVCAAAAIEGAGRTRAAFARHWLRAVPATVVVGSMLAAALIELVNPPPPPGPSPDPNMQRAAAGYRCVMSDSPETLIALNVLTADLQHGCPQWVDVSGRTYGVDRSAAHLPRRDNQRWQRDLLRYLRAGEAYVVVDIKREGLSRRTLALLDQGRLAVSGDRMVLRLDVPSRRIGPKA